MGSGRSKLAAQALVIIDQMMKANPHYEVRARLQDGDGPPPRGGEDGPS